jgi:hypothetical protein
VSFRDIADVIGRHLNVLVVSICSEQAGEHFGFLGNPFADVHRRSDSALTATFGLIAWQAAYTDRYSSK